MDIQFYRVGRFGDTVVFAAGNEQYLVGKHFLKEGESEGVSWVLPDEKKRYYSTLEQWKEDVLSYAGQVSSS